MLLKKRADVGVTLEGKTCFPNDFPFLLCSSVAGISGNFFILER